MKVASVDLLMFVCTCTAQHCRCLCVHVWHNTIVVCVYMYGTTLSLHLHGSESLFQSEGDLCADSWH